MAAMAALTSGALACVAFLSLIAHPQGGAATQSTLNGPGPARRSLAEVPTREICIEAADARDLSALQAMLKSITQGCGSMGCRYTRQAVDGAKYRISDALMFTTGRDWSCEGALADTVIRVLPSMGTVEDSEVHGRRRPDASDDPKALILRHEWLVHAEMAAELSMLVYEWLGLDEDWGYLPPVAAGRAGTAAAAAMAAANAAAAMSSAEENAPQNGQEDISSW